MKLYYHPISTYSQKVLLALSEKQADFEPEVVMLMDPEANAAYREIYPLGKIPLLVRDDGWMIPESTIIIEYLDTHYTAGPRLIPEDPEMARRVRFGDRMSDLYLNDSIATLVFQSWKPEADRDQEKIESAQRRAGVLYQYLDKTLADNEWLVGDFSMADCATAPALSYARDVLPFDEHPNISAYWQRLVARPSFAAVMEAAAPHLEELKAGVA